MASLPYYDTEVARVIIFDLRKSTSKDSRFTTAAQALYDTVILATSQNGSPGFSYITLIVVASKGFEYLLEGQPITRANKSLKRAFGRLKQLLCFFNKESIFSKRGSFGWMLSEVLSKHRKKFANEKIPQLEIFIMTLYEEQLVVQEVETFLYQHDDNCLQRLVLVHLLQSTIDKGNSELEKTLHRKLLVHAIVGKEKETRQFFKVWLKDVSRQWSLVMSKCDKWKVTVDLEQVLLNSNFGPATPGAAVKPTNERIEFFHRDAEYVRCLEIFHWIRADGVPLTLVHGSPRRVLPSEHVPCTSSPEENRNHFVSLWQWLTKENLIALIRLVPHDKITDFFVLTPGDDRSLLLRRIAPRELILPLSNVLEDFNLEVEDCSGESRKQDHYDDVHLACVQIPHLLEYNANEHECGLVAALERELQELTYSAPAVPPLQMKNPTRRK